MASASNASRSISASRACPAGAGVPPCRAPPNRPIWPDAVSSACAWARRRIVSAAANSRARLGPADRTRRPSTRFSTCIRFSWRGSIAGGEIGEISERRVAARVHHRLHRRHADLLHRGQRVADRQRAVVEPFHREIGRGTVDVGRQDAREAAFRLLLQCRQPVGVADRQAHAGGDEHLRVVGLQPGGLVGEQAVRRRVAFVEAIAGELRHQVEDFLGFRPASMPRAMAPLVKMSRCASISAGIFLPMARRNRSAPPSE